MDSAEDPKLVQATAVEGFLGKQRPGTIKVYQQRYCKFIDGGLTFAYAGTKEDFEQGKVKAQIPLKDVIEIKADEKPKKFHLVLNGRSYKFEAPSKDEKEKWVSAISVCREYAIRCEEQHKEEMAAIDEDIRFEDDNDGEQARGGLFGALAGTARDMVLKKALGAGVGILKAGVNTLGSAIMDSKPRSNEEYLKAKKLDTAFEQIDSKVLQSRLLMGYLLKESREATGLGLVDEFVNDAGLRDTIARRWCMLVSSKPIILNQVDPNDEGTLEAGKLPPEIELEVLYIYDDNCDNSKPLETVQLKDVLDVVVKKKTVTEQFYRFVLSNDKKNINLIATNATEMVMWVKAIQTAKANSKEKSKSKLPSVRNLFWHFKILQEQVSWLRILGEEKLRQKIYQEYEKVKPSQDTKIEGIKDLIKEQEKISDEFIAIVNACLVHKDQKVEVIRLYAEVFHESIMSALGSYKNQEGLENKDVFEMVKFLVWYRDRLKVFGGVFVDKRIIQGVATLCNIIGMRMLKNNMRTSRNIIRRELDKEPDIDGRGKSATTAPGDLFKMLNETFTVLSYCNTKELALALLESCSYTIDFFQNGLSFMMEQPSITIDQLSALCNNTLTYQNNLKEFGKQAEQLIGANKEIVHQYFNEPDFSQRFVSQGKKAYEKIVHRMFSPVKEEWDKTTFLYISLKNPITEALEKISGVVEKVHGNYGVKIETACLEKVVTFYVESFLEAVEKKTLTFEQSKAIKDKFEDDQLVLRDLFINLKKTVLDNTLGSLAHLYQMFDLNFGMIPSLVQNMKEQYGSSLKWSSLELLIRLRPDNISKEEKNELMRTCEQLYNTTQKKTEKVKYYNVFKHIDQIPDHRETSKSLTKRLDSASSSFSESDTASLDSSPTLRAQNSSKVTLNLDGYLEVEKDEFLSNVGGTLLSNLKFETKYFSLKRDVLYFYKDRKAEYAQGSYKLKELVNSGAENDKISFFLAFKTKEGQTKVIRFKASTSEKRDLWLNTIKEAILLTDIGGMTELNLDVQIFKDNKPLFNKGEEMPNLEFNLVGFQANQSQSQNPNSKRRGSFDLYDPEPVITISTKQEEDINRPIEPEKSCITCSMF